MSAGAVAAAVDAPQDPGVLETRLRPAKLGQVRAITGATDGVPAAFRDRRDVRRRALSWCYPRAVFLTALFIIPLYVCPSYDAHTPSIVSAVSLYITWFLSVPWSGARTRRATASTRRLVLRLPGGASNLEATSLDGCPQRCPISTRDSHRRAATREREGDTHSIHNNHR